MKKWQEDGKNNDPSKASLDQYCYFSYSKRKKEEGIQILPYLAKLR